MTEPAKLCPGVDRSGCRLELVDGGELCWSCIDLVRADLDPEKGLPWLQRELATTTAKLDRINAGHGVAGKLDGTLPLNLGAVAAKNHAPIVVAWTCELGYQPATFDVASCCVAILADINRLRCHVDGPEAARFIRKAAADWRYAIDPSSDRVFAGRCMCTSPGQNLYTRSDAERVRCRNCNTEHDADSLLAKVDEVVQDALLTRAELAAHARTVGIPASTLRTWRARKLLRPVIGPWEAARLYRFGDVLDLRDRDQAATDPASLSVSEVAQLLDLTIRGVRQRITRGTLPARKVNGEWRVNATELHLDTADRINA